MSQKKLTGAQILMRCLREEKVDLIFGYPGGAVLVIYDELFKQKEIRHILVRHEQGAAHAADAYARATGKPGVCLVTSGPGVTNAVTGIATAYMDSIPLVVISGQVPSHAIGLDAFQEVDTVGITRPCTKYNILVSSPEGIAPAIKKAFHVAVSGRPGPVLVDIPKDVTMQEAEYQYPRDIELRSYRPTTKGHPGQIKRALALIKSAQRPMIYSGGGVILANAAPDLVKFARALGAPVTNTLMGLGAFPGEDSQFVGMPGMHGTYEANMAMQHCDLLVAVGARFDDRVIGNPEHFAQEKRRIIHIDIDPSSISKRVRVDVPIVGDVGLVLRDLNRALEKSPIDKKNRRRLVAASRAMASEKLPALSAKSQADYAASRRRGALSGDGGRRDCDFGCRPAPDVGGAILQVRQAAALD